MPPTDSEVMRHILRALDKNIDQSARVYASLERIGLVVRESNVEGWQHLKYATSLANNEVRKHDRLIDEIPPIDQ